MSAELAFIGDIHGFLPALRGLVDALAARGKPHMVFLGDYINKGPQSAQVMGELLQHERAGRATLLRGNHETALLEAIENGDLTAFLKMGGAMTIRSYVGRKVGPDVLQDLRAAFPIEHLNTIRRMPSTHESDDFIARHDRAVRSTTKFEISAHAPVGTAPRIGPSSAQIDTGCGTAQGRLTALLWPSRDYVQVDSFGAVLKA